MKIKLYGILLGLLLLLSPSICSANTTSYQITAQQLQMLQTESAQQKNIIEMLRKELNILQLNNSEAHKLSIELLNSNKKMEIELNLLTKDLQNSNKALNEVNESFKIYSKEMSNKVRTVKMQRNIYSFLLIGAFTMAVT